MRATVIGPEIADVPQDGGKWALYCEHLNDAGEVVGVGLLQDTNKRRLSEWRTHSREWCPYCQEEAHT
jgi:hypothetical protein